MTLLHDRPLDLRDFQDIFEEAKRLIPKYCPEWTDHNLSDPGITLIELFAWMTEMILYQANRVPDEMYERFLDMVGVHRYPPVPALAEITFYLSAPRPGPITIPTETEVATDRTETQEAIVFTTTEPLTIPPPDLAGLRAWREEQGFEDYVPYVTSGLIEGPIFNEEPVEGDALYVGYAGDLAGASLQLRLECQEMEGVHIDPRNPPLAWEYWSAPVKDWAPLTLLDSSGTGRLRDPTDVDPTHGLNRSADVYIHIPDDSEPQVVDGLEATWFRVCYVQKEGQGYTKSPRITGIRSEAIGGTVLARQAQIVWDEVLGESDGTPDQSFVFGERPVLRRDEPHVITVVQGDDVAEWTEVEDFSQCGEEDRAFVIHYPSGEARFGPFIRDRDGTGRQHGAVPPKGALLRIRSYYSGGGIAGNVGAGTITQLESSIPYIANVMNYRAASGGLDEEYLEGAKLRSLSTLKRTAAAIAAEDYERLAQEVDGVGRARCLMPEQANGDVKPGAVRLLLVPHLPQLEQALTPEDLTPSPGLIEAVSGHLDEHRILGTVIQYSPAEFTWIEIDGHIFVKPGTDVAGVQEQALHRLRQLLHPIRGGPAGQGLNFGGTVTESQIAGLLQGMPEVVYVERIRLRPQGGAKDTSRVQAPPHSLLALGRCYVLAEVADENG